MTEPYQLPRATVLAARSSFDVAAVAIEMPQEDYLSYPIAPASLWKLDSDDCVYSFHQLILREGSLLVFETYGGDALPPPVGSIHRFCSWWMPAAMDAVQDLSAKWERIAYPETRGHDHCLLTWERVSAESEQKVGYRSSHGWLTVAAYEEFIERDRIRIRSRRRSIERPSNPPRNGPGLT